MQKYLKWYYYAYEDFYRFKCRLDELNMRKVHLYILALIPPFYILYLVSRYAITNSRVAPIADPFQPAVLRMIRQTIEAARGGGIGVALCGELAADPLATPLLLGLGLEEFSVSAPLIPELKRAISCWSVQEAEAVAQEALAMDSSQSVRRLLLAAAGARLRGPSPEPRKPS